MDFHVFRGMGAWCLKAGPATLIENVSWFPAWLLAIEGLPWFLEGQEVAFHAM